MSDIDIFSQPIQLNTDEVIPQKEETPKEIEKEVPTEEKTSERKEEKVKETLETIENLSVGDKSDNVPLKKYMSEKNARKEAEQKAQELEKELSKIRESSKSDSEIKLDVKALSQKHDIDEEALRDILEASYALTKQKVKEELENEINPKLQEFENIKKQQEQNAFEAKFNSLLSSTLAEMPEYKNIVDAEDLKEWVKSGKYSKLTFSELVEQKYSKFVQGKRTLESGNSVKENPAPKKVEEMTNEDYLNLDKDPELRKTWAESLENRLRNIL